MLTAADLWFGYEASAPVVRGISMTVPEGGLVGLLGPNGSGKTTLLRLLAGTRRAQRGSITLDGVALAECPRAVLARRIAVVPQETHLAFDYTVAEVAMMGRYPHLGAFEIEGPPDQAIVEASLAATGTAHLAARQFNTLSGGEKQRVVIAAALAQITFRLKPAGSLRLKPAGSFRLKPEATGEQPEDPSEESRLLLLDEPTASLDLAYQLEIMAVLARLHAEHRLAIVVSTHDLNLAAALCRTLVLVRDGRVLASGPVREVLTPANIRALYDVDAELIERADGRRLVVPLGRARG